jgi:hypothetical protein
MITSNYPEVSDFKNKTIHIRISSDRGWDYVCIYDNITNKSVCFECGRDELKELAEFINQYLEKN